MAAKQISTRIVIVDDHPMVRERLAEVINHEADLAVCGEADSRTQALALIATTRPNLVLVDLTLKNSYGFDLIKDIHIQYPQLPILVVSMHDEALHAERVLRAGARGYITKQAATKNILEAIRTVLNGQFYGSDELTKQLAAKAVLHPRRTSGVSLEDLTDRETQVFELIGRGYSTSQIAEKLHLDIKTIETYRARIKEKLCLKDANELLQTAIAWVHSGTSRLTDISEPDARFG